MYRKRTKGIVKHIDFVLLDMICLQLAFVLTYWIFQGSDGINPYSDSLYRIFALVIELVDILVIYSNGTYKDVIRRGTYKEFVSTVKHSVYIFLVCVVCAFVLQQAQSYSRLVFVGTFVVYIVLSYAARVLRKRSLIRKRDKQGSHSLLIVTSTDVAERVIADIRRTTYGMYNICGLVLVDDDSQRKSILNVPVVCSLDTVAKYVCNNWVDEVMIIPHPDKSCPREVEEKLISTGVTVHKTLAMVNSIPGRMQQVEKIAVYSVLTTSPIQMTNRQYILKRAIDIIAGLFGCLLTFILALILGPMIKKESPGPIFFKQERVGLNGKKFNMYKFRSMYMDAEARKAELMAQNKVSDARMFKMDFDPRVIGNKILPDGTQKKGIGQLIRDYSLDEFPQFLNVLKGDMSVVGTRPPLPGEVSLYELHHRARLSMKPGVTGLWQVSGRSDITDFEEVVALDRKYIDNWNLGSDVKIILKTIGVVLGKNGAS